MNLPGATRHFVGSMLMAIGGLMMTLCGLCSVLALAFVWRSLLSVIGGFLGEWLPGGDDLFVVKAFLLWGVTPFLAGGVLYLFGRRLRGTPTPERDETH